VSWRQLTSLDEPANELIELSNLVLLESSLKNDHVPQTFALKHRTEEGVVGLDARNVGIKC
jgi:hypothetical protein